MMIKYFMVSFHFSLFRNSEQRMLRDNHKIAKVNVMIAHDERIGMGGRGCSEQDIV